MADYAHVLFFHGKESNNQGSKVRYLQQHFPGVVAPDFAGMTLDVRLAKVDQQYLGEAAAYRRECPGPYTLIGSSLGGLTAALCYQKYTPAIEGLILLAPALHWDEAAQLQVFPERTVVVHGTADETVPYATVAAFCERHGLRLITVADDHRLSGSRVLLGELYRTYLQPRGH